MGVGFGRVHACDRGRGLTELASKRDHVVITAKRLDAPEREQAAVEVDVPRSEAAQQALLVELVRSRYPDAEFRSFAEEAASFLAHKLLVVAVYRRGTESLEDDEVVRDDESQQQLFAA